MNPKALKVNRMWSRSSVRNACVNNNLYTLGNNEEYEHMRDLVDRFYPTYEQMMIIAEDICKHSKDQTITNVMYILEKEAVITTFEINGSDEE